MFWIKTLFEKAVTLISNRSNLVPLTLLDKRKIASVAIGDSTKPLFQDVLEDYGPVRSSLYPWGLRSRNLTASSAMLTQFDIVLLSLHHARLYPEKAYGIPPDIISFIDSLPQANRVIFTFSEIHIYLVF